jgi:hypothetical protein
LVIGHLQIGVCKQLRGIIWEMFALGLPMQTLFPPARLSTPHSFP